MRLAGIEATGGDININSPLMLNNRIISSTASNTDNIISMNVKSNRIQQQSLNWDDCLIVNSLDTELGNTEILKLTRYNLRLPVPIVQCPTISQISNTLFYLDTYTLPIILTLYPT